MYPEIKFEILNYYYTKSQIQDVLSHFNFSFHHNSILKSYENLSDFKTPYLVHVFAPTVELFSNYISV